MVRSKAQLKAVEFYKDNSNKKRTLSPVSDERFEEIKDKFYYEFCPENGFYTTIKEALENDGFLIFPWQYDIADNYLMSVFKQVPMDLNISVLRQVGKTDFVSLCTAFVWEEFYREFQIPVSMAVFAPVKTTATIMFRRATEYMSPKAISDDMNTREKKGSVRGDQIQLFGIYDETKGSTVEGNTFDIIIRDEAHLGNDAKFIDETEPTRFSKNALLIRIGNGGKKDCDYFQSIQMGDKTNEDTGFVNRLVRYTWTEVEPYFEKLEKEGYEPASIRMKNIKEYIKKRGSSSIYVRKNIYCQWMLEMSSVIQKTQIDNCCFDLPKWNRHEENPSLLFLGFDVATMHDRTIATILDEDRNIVDWITVKEKDIKATTREQVEFLYEYCEDKGYNEHLIGIAFDATGLGSGGISELLDEYFPCDLLEYKFSGQRKHDWYVAALESMSTDYIEDRVKLPIWHPKLPEFSKDWTDLQRKELPEKKYDHFSAPKKQGYYDDYVASYAIAWDLMVNSSSYYKYKKEEETEDPIEEESILSQYTTAL